MSVGIRNHNCGACDLFYLCYKVCKCIITGVSAAVMLLWCDGGASMADSVSVQRERALAVPLT